MTDASPTRAPLLPPSARSRAAIGLTVAAATGRFALQACASCGTLQYPPRDACRRCLGVDLRWQDIPRGGTLLAETVVRASTSLYFGAQPPRRVGTVELDVGPRVVAFVHRDAARDGRVRMELRLDRAGQGILVAFPDPPTPLMEDDPMVAETAADPRHRRVLLTDGRSADAPALVAALREAGAAAVLVGESEGPHANPHRAALLAAGAEIVPLDVTETASVERLAAAAGDTVDILVNNARRVRPGGIGAGADLARELFETNALGLLRLAEAFGPLLRARAADGPSAWVNILAVDALAPSPGTAVFAGSQAAALSLTQALRADLATGGVRVVTVLVGPTDDEWHREVPPPTVAPTALARAVVDGLRRGLEEVVVGDVAREIVERWQASPAILQRERASDAGR